MSLAQESFENTLILKTLLSMDRAPGKLEHYTFVSVRCIFHLFFHAEDKNGKTSQVFNVHLRSTSKYCMLGKKVIYIYIIYTTV